MKKLEFNPEAKHDIIIPPFEEQPVCHFNNKTFYPDYMLTFHTGRIQCEVLTTLPILSSWIKKFLGQQSKIWDESSVEKLFR